MKRDVNDKAGDLSRREYPTRELDAAERRLANIVRFAAGAALGTMVMLWATGNAATDQVPEAQVPAATPITGPFEFILQAPAQAASEPAKAARPAQEPRVIGDYDMSQHNAAGDGGGGNALQSY